MLCFRVLVAVTLSAMFCAVSGCMSAENAAAKLAAEKAKQAWSEETRRALGFEDAASWKGGEAMSSPRKTGDGALRWAKHTKNSYLECLKAPTDLSAFNVMSFWLHSSHANDATFMIIAESQREKKVFS